MSLDVIEKYFCCDLEACRGECCVAGDAGAPLTDGEDARLRELLPAVRPLLTEKAARAIDEEGPSYRDTEGDIVTQLVEGGCCVYTCMEPGGLCLCALEKARRAGDERMFKPVSCALYPVRVKDYGSFRAVNYDRWKICRPAEALGRKKGLRVYEFLKEPLIRRFGQEWYDELALAAREWLSQHSDL